MTPPLESLPPEGEVSNKCPYQDDCYCIKKEHKEDHEFVRSAMRVLSKLEDIKWSTFKAVVVSFVFLIIGIFGIGLISKIKGFLGI